LRPAPLDARAVPILKCRRVRRAAGGRSFK
jgi:hypothetical protein